MDVDLPIAVLREAFDVNLTAGILRWRRRPREHFLAEREWILTNGKLAGKVAGTRRARGDRQIRLRWRGVLYRSFVHRIIWAMAHDRWPAAGIDHARGVEAGDGIDNLREATQADQAQNKVGWSGRLMGVERHGRGWRARIGFNRGYKYLGTFDTPEEAHAAYLEAKTKCHLFNPTMRS